MLDHYDLLDDSIEEDDFGIELEEYDDEDFYSLVGDSLEFPCLKIMDEISQEEFDFLQKRKFECNTSLPLFCSVEGTNKLIGRLDVTLDTLLALSQIYHYDLRLYKTQDDFTVIKLDDPVFLQKFIRL